MRLKIVVMIIMVTALLAACSQQSEESIHIETTDDLKELVNDYSTGKMSGDESHQASITSKELIITEEDSRTVYDLPKEEFFVSIAPFINDTHP